MAVALIVAAGRGERLGSDRPKALVALAGRPMLEWSVEGLRGGAGGGGGVGGRGGAAGGVGGRADRGGAAGRLAGRRTGWDGRRGRGSRALSVRARGAP